ncbi:MAG: hypothetical protein HYV63_07740 [Candidatus Schekmanbacteria bacterium]|nr:hypothetical protein [Candidatus Schekmanbacteria bacterium]
MNEIERFSELLATHAPAWVSFDFFDTCVIRPYAHPTDVFLEVGRRLLDAGVVAMRHSLRELRAVRREAEERARVVALRERGTAEIALHDIYEAIAAAGIIAPEQIESACRQETAVEGESLRLSPRVAPLLRACARAGLGLVIVSDTYFSAATLQAFFARVQDGLPPADRVEASRIYASAERGAGKGDRLFELVLVDLGITAGELLHVGDNPHADVARPRELGIAVFPVLRFTPPCDDVLSLERRFRTRRAAADHYLLAVRSSAGAAVAAPPGSPEHAAFTVGSFVVGPVFLAFLLWLTRTALRDEVRRLAFMTRDGVFLRELFDRAQAAWGLPIRSELALVSRLSTYVPCLTTIDEGALHAVLNRQRAYPTLAEFARTFGLSVESMAEHLASLGPESTMTPGPVRERVVALALRRPFRDLIAAHAEEQRHLLVAHLETIGLGREPLCFVDLGWNGTIQQQIVTALRTAGRDEAPRALYLSLREHACVDDLGRWGRAQSFVPVDDARGLNEVIWRSPELLEQAAMPDMGSVESYERCDGGVAARLGPPDSRPQVALRAALQDGVRVFLRQYLDVTGAAGAPWEHAGDVGLWAEEILARHLLYPIDCEVELACQMYHDDNMGTGARRPIVSAAQVAAAAGRTLHSLWRDLDVYWPAAVVQRAAPELLPALSAHVLAGAPGDERVVTADSASLTAAVCQQRKELEVARAETAAVCRQRAELEVAVCQQREELEAARAELDRLRRSPAVRDERVVTADSASLAAAVCQQREELEVARAELRRLRRSPAVRLEARVRSVPILHATARRVMASARWLHARLPASIKARVRGLLARL